MTPAPLYGGQAVIEGVLIRGQRTVSLACRRPDGSIYRYREPLRSPLLQPGPARWPFLRGVIVLWESLSYGTRFLMRSADVQLESAGESPRGSGVAVAIAFVLALLLFVGLPYLATQALRGALGSDLGANLAEGGLRLALFLGYLAAISRLPEIRRVFAYHGAEHMTIHAFEHGDPLDRSHVRPYPTAHPRCGTAFLLVVVVLTILAFAFVPRGLFVVDLVVRLALVLPIAAASYEVLRIVARHERSAVGRALAAPGLLLQAITTRRPDDDMIDVAIASLEEALVGDAQTSA